MSPLAQVTELDHGGGLGDEVTEDQCGSPERETETTDQPRWAAARQMREPGRYQLCTSNVVDMYPCLELKEDI
jgi:hypothetical protein